MDSFTPWVEKYRPQKITEIIGHNSITQRLQAYAATKNLPNLLFAGSPGSGKTTAALALARELYGEAMQQSFSELNASVTPDTPILVRINGKISRTNFGQLAARYFKGYSSSHAKTSGLEILSVDGNNAVVFQKASLISRHKVDKVATIRYEGGAVRTSLNHSVIVIGENGSLTSKMVSELKEGDQLITFVSNIGGQPVMLDFEPFKPKLITTVNGKTRLNPKVKSVIEDNLLSPEMAYVFGLYLAEGCATLERQQTSGQSIFTVAYPQELGIVKGVQSLLEGKYGVSTTIHTASSGFDRSRFSSVQLRIFNTQLAKFFKKNFYGEENSHNARTKRTPSFMFEAQEPCRLAFLNGYTGDGYGTWGEFVRYSSRSVENLIDVAWLGRLSGIGTSVYKDEVRAVWKIPSFTYYIYDLLPAEPFIKLLSESNPAYNWRYMLRHQLYSKKSKRIARSLAQQILAICSLSNKEFKLANNLKRLVNSPLSVVSIKKITIREYDDWVYDVSVPGSQAFFGGTAPVLLHNSDERGIDVVRGRIKDFARTLPVADVPFKILLLDEADSLTADAQQALRRTMEKYSSNTRFILSANSSSRIIEAIQSRCALFRFTPLTGVDLTALVQRVAKAEQLTLDKEALEAVLYVADGDARKALNCLQGGSAISQKVTADMVYSISSRARPKEINEMLASARQGNFLEARKMLDKLMIEYGMTGEDILVQLFQEVSRSKEIEDKIKLAMVEKIGECDFRLSEGSNDRIQLEALLAGFALVK